MDAERDLLVTGPHPLNTQYSLLVVPAALVLTALFSGSLSFFAFAVVAASVIGLPLAIAARLTMSTTRLTVTTRRVIWTRGILVKNQYAVLLEKVESISIEQSPLGQYFGFGAIHITGTGGSTQNFVGVRDPQGIRDVVNSQIASLVRH